MFTIEKDNDLPSDLKIEGFKINVDASRKLSVVIPKDVALNELFANETFRELKINNIKNQTNRLEELFINLTTKK